MRENRAKIFFHLNAILRLFLFASNSARFGCCVSKWSLRLFSVDTETKFRQTKHSTFEFTTVNKYLFVHFELSALPFLFMFFFFLFSVIVVCCKSNTTNCLLTNKLKVKMLVKKAHAVDFNFKPVSQWRQLSCVFIFLQSYDQKVPVSKWQPNLYNCKPANVKIITIKLLPVIAWTNGSQTFKVCGLLYKLSTSVAPSSTVLDGFSIGEHYRLDQRALLFLTYTIEKKTKECQKPLG